MKRWSIWLLQAVVAGRICAVEEALPQDPEEPLEIEPPMLIQSRAADGTLVVQGADPLTDPEMEMAKLERDLTRAKRNASGGERLYQSGIISKVDAENRALRVIQLEAKLAEAHLANIKVQAGQQAEDGNASAGNVTVAQAVETARRAAEVKQGAELEAALRNLQRQQKLLALGSGRKADVHRAEQKLAALQQPQN
ncbi:MAG: hypothetical protein M3Q89_06410 [Verrucomicrobiota bacterium]|nr:hypothetical protein [Verrucomicrobiota bacterium]